MSTRNKIFIGIGAGVIIGLGIFFSWYFGYIGSGNRYLYRTIRKNPDLIALFNKAQDQEAKIKATPDNAALYLSLGLTWKSLGDLSGTEAFYKNSLASYEEGIKRFGSKNILFYLNAG